MLGGTQGPAPFQALEVSRLWGHTIIFKFVLSPPHTRTLLHIVFLTSSIAALACKVSPCPDRPGLTLRSLFEFHFPHPLLISCSSHSLSAVPARSSLPLPITTSLYPSLSRLVPSNHSLAIPSLPIAHPNTFSPS